MSNIAVTDVVQIAPVFTDPGHCEMYNVKLTEAVTAGQCLCWAAAGTMSLADGNDAALDEPQAIALRSAAAGATISVLKRGMCAGFTVSGINVGVKITLTDTPGTMEEAGSGEFCGRVVATPEAGTTDRIIYFDFQTDVSGIG